MIRLLSILIFTLALQLTFAQHSPSPNNSPRTTPLIQLNKAKGTISQPTAVNTGDTLGFIRAQGYDGSNYQLSSGILFPVENSNGSQIESGISFITGGNNPTSNLYISSNGKIGVGTNSPQEKFHVTGTIRSDALFGGGNVSADPFGNLIISTATGANNPWTFIGNDIYHNSGKVGIGTATPSASLHINGNMGLLAEGTLGLGSIPTSGEGTRMLFYPTKSAFRVGTVSDLSASESTYWDADSIGTYSFATGQNTKAKGEHAVAMGFKTEATGDGSMATGFATKATGSRSTAMGFQTIASGMNATSLGFSTTASGNNSIAMGLISIASGTESVAIGSTTAASGNNSTAMGEGTTASANNSTAMGEGSIASGPNSTAMGRQTRAEGEDATSMGRETQAIGDRSTAMGFRSIAQGDGSTAMGDSTFALGPNSTALGIGTIASGPESMAMGVETEASGLHATAMGKHTIASGGGSTAMGIYSIASADHTTAIGNNALALAENSTSIGYLTVASGEESIAMGDSALASADHSLSIGHFTKATGLSSVAFGYRTHASGDFSTVLGSQASAAGMTGAFVYGDYSSSQVISPTADHQFVVRASGGFHFHADSSAGEAQSVFIETGGNLGIGIANPSHPLHIATASNPLRLEGLEQTTGSTHMLVVDVNGVVRKQDISNSAGGGTGTGTNAWLFSGSGTGVNDPVYRNGNVGIGVTNPSAKFEVQNGAVVFAGGIGSSSISGAGTRLMWIPEKQAFRAGAITSSQWDSTNIGTASTATGFSTMASGSYSTAMGKETEAAGEGATSLGFQTLASGDFSTAMGYGTEASGYISTALGLNSVASGNYAFTTGASTTASGLHSVALGELTTAMGNAAVAMGASNVAEGHYSVATGQDNRSSFASLALGRNNLDNGNANTWVSTDYVLTIGDGLNNAAGRSNAAYIQKNGNMWIQGTLTQSSDIRLKENVRVIENVHESLMNLNGVKYEWKDRSKMGDDTQVGLIAQEVEAVFPELVIEVEDFKAVNYIGLIPVLIEGYKQQQQGIEALAKENQELKARLDALDGGSAAKPSRVDTEEVQLFSNRPNPFGEQTSIGYYLPTEVQQAELVLTNANGQAIAHYPLRERGHAEVVIERENLSAGMYIYSLIVEGERMMSKRMWVE